VNTVHSTAIDREPTVLRRRSRLTFNEQLCLFGSGNEVVSTQASFGWWATLALVLAIAPWVLIGLMIWMFA
jgi:hypothetical protein